MKTKLLYLLLLLTTAGSAQIVNIPDPVFKSKLLEANTSNGIALNYSGASIIIDTNNDGEIQINEALPVRELIISNEPISSLEGIEAFIYLEYLFASHMNLVSLDLSEMNNLEHVMLEANNLTSLILTGNNHLKVLQCAENNLTSLDLTGLSQLEYLDCRNNQLVNLDLSSTPLLTNLNYSYNNITNLNMTGVPNLVLLDCGDNNITTIDVSGLLSLGSLSCENNNISSLDISELSGLNVLFCDGNNITSLDLVAPGLTFVTCDDNNIEQLNIGQLPTLDFLYCNGNQISQLDISGCPALTDLKFHNNEELKHINLKNGSSLNYPLYLVNLPQLEFICTDETEQDSVMSSLQQAGMQNVVVNSYCDFTPGGNYNTIAGVFFLDTNNDGCEEEDTIHGYAKVSINDATETGATYTGIDGAYSFYTQTGSFTLTPEFENDWFNVTPEFATVNITELNSTTTQNFCISANGVHPDLEVVIIPASPAQPGFDATYQIVYKNKGNQVLSGSLNFYFDEDVLDFVSASPAQSFTGTGTVTWQYTDLLPFESRNVHAVLNLNGPMETPAVNLDDVLGFSASIPITNDETPDDNFFYITQVVTGSYDPNDITCLEGDYVTPEKIGQYLHYNINFENTGTAPATFIVVKNMINEAQFDVSSLQLLYASHEVEARVDGNKVEFFFDAIGLGPQEKGNIVFKIRTLGSLQVNDNVAQQAEIFFDYNWPIETNEAVTVFEALGIKDFTEDNSVKIYPNPATDFVTVSAKGIIRSLQLYDVQGRLLQTSITDTPDARFDITARAAGIYFLKVTTDAGISAEKIVKK